MLHEQHSVSYKKNGVRWCRMTAACKASGIVSSRLVFTLACSAYYESRASERGDEHSQSLEVRQVVPDVLWGVAIQTSSAVHLLC